MIDKNDPRLTAFVLGELEQAELREITAAIDSSPELQTAIDEIRETIELLDSTYKLEAEVSLGEQQHQELDKAVQTPATMPVKSTSVSERRFYRESLFYWSIGIAAALLLMLIPLSSYFDGSQHNWELAKNEAGRDARVDEDLVERDEATMLPPSSSSSAVPSPAPAANPEAFFDPVVKPNFEGDFGEQSPLMDAEKELPSENASQQGLLGLEGRFADPESPMPSANAIEFPKLAVTDDAEKSVNEDDVALELEFDSKLLSRKKFQELAQKGSATDQLGAIALDPPVYLPRQRNGESKEPAVVTEEVENSVIVGDRIAALAADRQRVVAALEAGGKSAEEAYWILRQNNRMKSSGWEEAPRVENTENLNREISQMEHELRELNSRLGGSHPQIKALNDQIDFWKDYVAKSENEEKTSLEDVEPEVALRRYLRAIDQQTKELKSNIEAKPESQGAEAPPSVADLIPNLLKRVDPSGTREIALQAIPEAGIIVLEGNDKDVEIVRNMINEIIRNDEGDSDTGKRIAEKLGRELEPAIAAHNNEVRRKKTKTWKRVKAIPNTTRLMVGDKQELELNGMQVNVQVDGFRARVLIDCFYYNHFDRQLEGKFKLRLPDDASLYYFAFGQSVYKYEQNGPLAAEEFLPNNRQFVSLRADDIGRVRQDAWQNVKEARMVPREKAAHAYRQTVRRRVDPALVEWSGAGVFNANVFPLMPHKLHRVVIGYDVNLTQTDDGLAYELNLPEQTGECHVNLNVLEFENAQYSITPDVDPVKGIARSERVKDEQFDEVAKLEQQRNQMLQRLGKGHPEIRKLDAQIDALMANRKRVDQDDEIARLVERQYRFENPKTESIKLSLSTDGALMLRSDDKKEGSYWSTRITPQIPKVAAKGNDRAVFLVDTSLSSQPDKFNVWLKLLESTLENNRDSLKKFAVVFFNVENHFWKHEYTENNAPNVAALKDHCQKLALEGATDLYGALERVNNTDWISADDARPDLFLLSDGAANWGETNLQLINQLVAKENLGSLFAYQTGLTGTAISNLRFIAGQSGGAVFSVASEDEIKRASTAHTQRPWRLTGIEVDGTTDVMTAGRVQWIYPGQSLTVVGRVKDVDAAALGSVRLLLEQAGEQKTVDVPMATEVKTNLASRMYGQVAVGQLESLGELVLDVATAYARHFRITGQSCSLLMLESEADYKRFDIKPEEDLFVIKTRDAKRLVKTTLENKAAELADPKQQLRSWLKRLESMAGMNFKMPTALKLALDDIQVVAISEPLKCMPTMRDSVSDDYLKELTSEQLDYATIKAEAKRRFDNPQLRQSNDEALKVLSNLIERNPGDLVLAKDVAYAAMELHRPAQAYHLLRRVTEARPYEGSNYFALGQCLSQLGQPDMAMIYYEVAIASNFQNRDQDFKKIAATEYAHMLRRVVDGREDSAVKDFAEARLQSLTEKLNIRPTDVVVTMMWNTDQTDVDLHVIEPSGEECFYQHKSTKSGGQITRDITDGFGPEMYTLANAPDGEYQVLVKYYSSNLNRTDLRSKVYLSVYRDFGRPTASVTRKTVELSEVGGKEVVDTLQVK